MCWMKNDIYDPAFVADLFDRCSGNYRWWSAVSSFGFIYVWRKQCVGRLPATHDPSAIAVDLMAGTGEIWPHLLRRLPDLKTITALDISHRMHTEAVERLHGTYADKITHLEADALQTDLPADYATFVVSTFGLKTFNPEQQSILAEQIARILKPGGHFSLIEASDPKRFFLKGAQDFSMIGTYTRNFSSCNHMADALCAAGLDVTLKKHFFGCATSVAGQKPVARKPDAP